MKRICKLATIGAIVSTVLATAYAASSPLSISADELVYNANTQLVEVSGHVLVKQNGNDVTAQTGTYNTKTQEAVLKGNVQITGEEISGHAMQMDLYGNEKVVGIGNAYFKKGTQELQGDRVEYNTVTGYGNITGNGMIKNEDYQLEAPHINAWTKKIYAKGNGGVKLRSFTQNIYATGNEIEYFQTPEQNDGVAYIRGNAYVEQDGNKFTGKTLKVYMDKNIVETEGRSTLVITQQ